MKKAPKTLAADFAAAARDIEALRVAAIARPLDPAVTAAIVERIEAIGAAHDATPSRFQHALALLEAVAADPNDNDRDDAARTLAIIRGDQ